MSDLFNREIKSILNKAQRIAKKQHQPSVTTAELLEAMLMTKDTAAAEFLMNENISIGDVAAIVETYLENSTPVELAYVPLSSKVRFVLNQTVKEIEKFGDENANSLHLLLALLLQDQSIAGQIIDELTNNREKMIQKLLEQIGSANNPELTKVLSGQEEEVAASLPNLEQVSRNLSKMASNGELDPVIGRDQEITRALQVLGRRTKNNPVFRGEPGVGKTAIAEGIAIRIATGDVPQKFINKQIIMLDMGSVVAGTKYRGEFENRMKNIIEEVRQHPEIILFIDELHTLIGAGGSEGSVDASNILKPALSRGEIQIMGATTYDEYQKYIEKDRAFERRFAAIDIDEPSVDTTITMLQGLKEKYEKYHHVVLTDEAIEAAAKLSDRYLSDRKLPDKAIDLMDEASSTANLAEDSLDKKLSELQKAWQQLETAKRQAIIENDFEAAKKIRSEQQDVIKKQERLEKRQANKKAPIITATNIAELLAQWTGIPASQMQESESKRLLNLETELHHRVIGQEQAVNVVARAIRRSRSGLNDPKRPIGSFMFLGPTGVGKTELAKTIAEFLFGSEDALIRVDMSEFMSRENVSRLVGSAPGYVGYEEGGQLTEQVRHKPYSVILFDEVEKAHPEVFNILLQVLDDGYLKDAKGRHVDFKNTIIIMTSNLGATELRDDKQVGFGAQTTINDEAMAKKMQEAMKQHFRPEFINRIDEVVVFHSLKEEQIAQIVKLMISDVARRVAEQGYELKVTQTAIKAIAKEGFDVEYGARPLRRTIQKEIEDRLADLLLENQLAPASKITIGYKNNEFYTKVADK